MCSKRAISTAAPRCYNRLVTEFRILGPLEVVDSTGPIPLGGPKQRALLGLLLVHAGEVLSTDQIVDVLWDGRPPKTATTSLWNLVTQLRKVLPPDTLVTKPPGYRLQIDPDALDLRRFEHLVARARQLEPGPRAELLREALALWRRAAIAGIAFGTFGGGQVRGRAEA